MLCIEQAPKQPIVLGTTPVWRADFAIFLSSANVFIIVKKLIFFLKKIY